MDYVAILNNKLSSPATSGTGKKQTKQKEKKETIPPGRRIVTIPESGIGGDEPPPSLQEKKTSEEVRKLQINNEKELKNLFLMSLFNSIMGEISHSVQVNFVDIPRRESSRLAAQWGVPEKERQIEKDISDIIAGGIDSFCSKIEELMDDEVFD